MDTATQPLLYRSEAFAEDVLDLVAGRPVPVQAPVDWAPQRGSPSTRRAVSSGPPATPG